MNPKSTRDFELLYNELETWVQKEVKEMNSTQLSEVERKARMADILAKQTKALQTIDRLKVEASKLGKEKRVDRMLDLMAKPKLWELGTGEVQEVHTQFTVRAAELMDLYKGLSDYKVSLDERLDVLLNVKVRTHDWNRKPALLLFVLTALSLLLAPRAACLCAPNPTKLSVDGSRVRLRLESRYRGSLRPRSRDVESWQEY